MLSVLLLVLFALAHGAMRSDGGQSRGVAAALQMVKQLVSGGEFVVADHTAEDHLLLSNLLPSCG